MWAFVQEDGTLRSPIAKFLSAAEIEQITARLEATAGDLLLIVADTEATAAAVLSALRLELARRFELVPADRHDILWVVDFPAFFWDAEAGRWDAAHHPFTAPAGDLSDPAIAQLPRLRPRARRRRDRRRLDPHPSARGAGAGVRAARGSAPRRPRRGSASCSTRCATARRRTAGSRWASTGSPPRSPARVDPRGDRVPEGGQRRRPAHRRAGAGRPRAAARARPAAAPERGAGRRPAIAAGLMLAAPRCRQHEQDGQGLQTADRAARRHRRGLRAVGDDAQAELADQRRQRGQHRQEPEPRAAERRDRRRHGAVATSNARERPPAAVVATRLGAAVSRAPASSTAAPRSRRAVAAGRGQAPAHVHHAVPRAHHGAAAHPSAPPPTSRAAGRLALVTRALAPTRCWRCSSTTRPPPMTAPSTASSPTVAGAPRRGGQARGPAHRGRELRDASTQQIPVSSSPTLLIVDRTRSATELVGFADRFEIAQRVADALAVK